MIPSTFGYVRPASLDEAVQLLAGDPEAKVLAGGHSLIPLLKLRLASPSQVVDIGRLPNLSYVREDGQHIAVGALTTHYQVASAPLIRQHLPLLASAAAVIGDVQVRNRGTIGGSLAHADPAADLPAAVLALDAVLAVQGPAGRREIPASSFFVDLMTTALQPGEVLTEIRFPRSPDKVGGSYVKFNYRAIDWAIVGAAARLVIDGGAVQEAAVALTAVGPTPVRAAAVEQALRGQKWSADLATAAAEAASQGLDPPGDHRASSEYRLHLARVVTRRALIAAAPPT